MMILSDKIKKFAVVFLSFAVMLCSSCGGDEEPDETEETVETVVVTNEDGEPVLDEEGNPVTEPVEEEEPVVYKVGFIYNYSATEGSTNKMFESARALIEKDLDIETCYIEGALVADVSDVVNKLKDEGCNIIVSCSPRFANSISKEASADKNTYFLSYGGTKSGSNISCFGGELYQTAQVCGIAAAHNTQTNAIGVVADPAEYNVYGVVDGFALGASEIWGAYTNINLNWAWSNDDKKIEEAIDNLVAEKNCDIIMLYLNSDHGAEYCESKGIKVIPNAFDAPEIANDCYITGFYSNFGTFLVDEVRSIQFNNFVSKVYAGNIASGYARLVDFGDAAAEGTDEISTALYDFIKSGQAHTFTGEIKNRDGKIMIEKGQQLGFSNITEINWLVQGIRIVEDYTTINEDPESSDMKIHY